MDGEEREKQLNKIKEKRGYVATNFAFIEGIMADVISFHYFKNRNEAFVTDVLEDEYFNFGLRLKILKKVFFAQNVKFPDDMFHKLSRYRNIMVHSQVVAQSRVIKGTNIGFDIEKIDFKHGGKEYDPDHVFEEYEKAESEVRNILSRVPGGTFEKVEFN